MSIVSAKQMLLKAQQGGYAVAAFNVENMEMVQAVCDSANKLKAPVIIATSASALKYAPPALFAAMVYAVAKETSIPVALHLDHGNSFELCEACVKAGYSSVMIDASQQPYEENVKLSRAVVKLCTTYQVPVEAELGHVGGKEDDIESENDLGTDPIQAAEFVKQTGVNSLAVAIGTTHGVYQGAPKLDFERLSSIRSAVDIPLVLHGASGLSGDAVRACVSRGICKINYATELRAAYTAAVRHVLIENPEAIDPKIFGRAARKCVSEVVLEKMTVLGCEGKA